ncbi:MAG: transposase [Saprospiraceae bacterium]|jgi:REP element-mobilizing transposase RayT|nr:transposase [Saprospiraceae bacterium]
MKYNPSIHHRVSTRLKGYDYSRPGAYFVTACTYKRKCIFGEIKQGQMVLNEFGLIAQDQWFKLPERFPHIELGEFIVMPNHIHGIIIIHPSPPSPVGARFTLAPETGFTPAPDPGRATARVAPTVARVAPTVARVAPTTTVAPTATAAKIGEIIGAYKSLVSNEILKIFKSKNQRMGKIWQRNYHDRIIRDKASMNRVGNYIKNNPAKWKEDKLRKR